METSSFMQQIWVKGRQLIKAGVVVLILLLLLIPASLLQELVQERQSRNDEVVAEVSSKWGGIQSITGPVLVLPLRKPADSAGGLAEQQQQYAYFLPASLDIDGELEPVEKHRGMFKVMLYQASLRISASFAPPDLAKLGLGTGDVIWSEARIKLPVSDPGGLKDAVRLKVNEDTLVMGQQARRDAAIPFALEAKLPWSSAADAGHLAISGSMGIQGSEHLYFTPLGENTDVHLRSAWAHPSFAGDALPASSAVSSKGFTAQWKRAAHNRPFPQQWLGSSYTLNGLPAVNADKNVEASAANNLQGSAFGVSLVTPVGDYQKVMRSVKYAALIILLTFACFFLLETASKAFVHPLHYALIGAALIIFYSLLLSFSEYTGFNFAYGISAALTIGLIGWFAKGLLRSSKLSLILSVLMLMLYTYIFTILQLQDYALLLGSIGLFVTLAVMMHFSRKLQW